MGTLAFPLSWGGSATGLLPTIVQADVWANRALYQQAGNLVQFTNVGGGQTAAAGGTFMRWTGTRWKIVSDGLLDSVDTANAGVANVTPQNLNPNAATVPAGVIQATDRLDCEFGFSKSSTVDTATLALRFGSLFTAADALLGTFTLTTTEVSAGFRLKLKRLSATTFQAQGAGNMQNSMGGASTLAYPSAVALNGADSFDVTAMRFSLWQTMSTGAEFVTLQDMEIFLRSTDS